MHANFLFALKGFYATFKSHQLLSPTDGKATNGFEQND
jgi:hypothetical protein